MVLEIPSCQSYTDDTFTEHPKSKQLDSLIENYSSKGIPGISAILYDPDKGLFIGTAGVSSIENQTPLENCHLFPSASISKMYAAVITLSLHEQGLLNIDDFLSDHLPSDLINKLPNGKTAQIKHLLNHSSGIPEHENSIKLTWDAFHDPKLDRRSDLEFLEYIYNKNPLFPTGEKTRYSTSGIIVEDLILENIMDQPHADLFDDVIVEKAGYSNTHFSNSLGYPFIDGTVNTYWDIYGNGNLVNSIQLTDGVSGNYDYYLGSSKVMFTAYELFLFVKGVFEDNLFFSTTTVEKMKAIKFEDNSTTDGYGFGLEIKVDPLSGIRYGHQGGSIGVNNHVYWYEKNGGIIVLLSNIAGFGSSPAGNTLSSEVIQDGETLLGEFEKILLE